MVNVKVCPLLRDLLREVLLYRRTLLLDANTSFLSVQNLHNSDTLGPGVSYYRMVNVSDLKMRPLLRDFFYLFGVSFIRGSTVSKNFVVRCKHEFSLCHRCQRDKQSRAEHETTPHSLSLSSSPTSPKTSLSEISTPHLPPLPLLSLLTHLPTQLLTKTTPLIHPI